LNQRGEIVIEMDEDKVDVEKHGCNCGPEPTRRDFLCRTPYMVFCALAAAGIGSDNLHAFPVAMVSANPQGSECSYDIPSSDGASIDSGNQVILVRNAGHIYAFSLACPHENTELRWRPQDSRFQCPRHQSKYQPDGSFISGRATRNMDRFALRLEGRKIVVELNKLYRSDKQKSDWQSAFVSI
jgi:nitrite reductase/ring-hydroxylating ferredoxin subunit